MSNIRFRDIKTEEQVRELLAPKPETYIRIVNGVFFKHTIHPDGRHTVETLSNID